MKKTARIVIGANLGDEGKGTVVAHYVKQSKDAPTLNVLTNGGAQRAHSVVSDNGEFTFQHFGSGTCYGADSYFSKSFILNPMQFANEVFSLDNRLDLGKIYRHRDCRWTTPFDQMFNLAIETNRGDKKHGSCGMGIWETVLRYNTFDCLPFDKFILMDDKEKRKYLKSVKTYFEKIRRIALPKKLYGPWHSEGLIDHFIADCKLLYSRTTVADQKLLNEKYANIILENGQGLLLNDDPNNVHTTPSNTGLDDSLPILKDFNINPEDTTVHYVTRPYLTRHGAGFLDSERNRRNISQSIQEDRTNHYNSSQGDFRYGCLDISDLKKRIDSDFSKSSGFSKILEITHCDEMDRVSEFKKYFKDIHTFDKKEV